MKNGKITKLQKFSLGLLVLEVMFCLFMAVLATFGVVIWKIVFISLIPLIEMSVIYVYLDFRLGWEPSVKKYLITKGNGRYGRKNY